MQKEKEQQDKLNAVKPRLLYGDESEKNPRDREESHYSESKTPTAQTEPRRRHGNRHYRSPSPTASVFKRLIRNRPPSPRLRPRKEGMTESWAMPTWCHMFNSTLTGNTRVWFDKLPKEFIDSYEDLRAAFRETYLQQTKHIKDPVEIHHIKQKDGESMEDFMERYKAEVVGKVVACSSRAKTYMTCQGTKEGGNWPERLNPKILMVKSWEKVSQAKDYPELSLPWGKYISFTNLGDEGRKRRPMIIEENRKDTSFTEMLWPEHEDGGPGYTTHPHRFSENPFRPTPGIRKICVVPSTAHGMLKFPVDRRIVTLRSSRIIPMECAMISRPSTQPPVVNQVLEEKLKVVIHPEYPEQTIATGSTLTEKGERNDVLTIQTSKSVVQAPERNKAIQEEVEKLVDAGIMKEVHYHIWRLIAAGDSLKSEVFSVVTPSIASLRRIQRGFRKQIGAPGRFMSMTCGSGHHGSYTALGLNDRKGSKQTASVTLVYFLSRALRGPEINYTPMEKWVLALLSASRRLKRYFQAHTVVVITNQPIKQLLSNSEISGRMLKWKFELEGSSCVDGSGAGLILTNPEGVEFTYAMRFKFEATNNEAEYEALIAGLQIAEQMGVVNLQANVDSRLVANHYRGAKTRRRVISPCVSYSVIAPQLAKDDGVLDNTVFATKSERDIIDEGENNEAEERTTEEVMKTNCEEHKVETPKEIIVEEICKDLEIQTNNLEADVEIADIETDDELHAAEEYEAWRLRKIVRSKRDREERNNMVKEKERMMI
ncbi:reverse transcriptase domain-containing protein [Tanacetum coccineum]